MINLDLKGETASQVGLKVDMEKRHFYHAAGCFLENANARTLQDDLGNFLYKQYKSLNNQE